MRGGVGAGLELQPAQISTAYTSGITTEGHSNPFGVGTEAPVPPVGTTVACARLDYSDSYVPDYWSPSAGDRVPPVGTAVHCAQLDCSDFCVPDCVPELLESVCDMEESLPVAGDAVLPEMSPVVFAGLAAVPVSLPAVAGAVPSAVFAGGGSLLTRLLRPTEGRSLSE